MKSRVKQWIVVIGLLIVCGIKLYPPKEAFNLGLDLQGGTYITLAPDWGKLSKEEVEEKNKQGDIIDLAKEVIKNRIDAFGVAEAIVQKGAGQTLIVQVPGIGSKGSDRIKGIIMKQAFLEFSIVEESPSIRKRFERAKGGAIKKKYKLLPLEGKGEEEKFLLVLARPSVTGDMLKEAFVGFGSDAFTGNSVSIRFDRRGAKRFEKVTGENVNKKLAIILDGKIQSAPVIQTRISGGSASITGNFTVDEAKDLALTLRAGALPVPLKIIQENVVGPSLGKDSINRGVLSALLGFIVVLLFMIFFYKKLGIMSGVALLINVILLLSGLSYLDATLTLPGIAGIILTLGMAVDANVLIFERIKEEWKMGRSAKLAVQTGFKRAFGAIFDSNVTTLLTALILMKFGTGPIRGFAVTLGLGILTSFFSAFFVTRLCCQSVPPKFFFKEV